MGIEKLPLKNQPRFRDYKYVVLLVKGPLSPRKGRSLKSQVTYLYAKSIKEIETQIKPQIEHGIKMLVYKANHDLIYAYENK